MSQYNGRVLIVEDDPVEGAKLNKSIENLGYAVQYVDSGEKALEVLEGDKPDLILLDVYLPGINGLEVLDRIKSNPIYEEIRVILISADDSEDLTVMGYIKQADEFLHKPIRHGELGVKLRVWMERKAHREQMIRLTNQLTNEKKVLAQYFSEDVVRQIEKGDSNLKGGNITATILFLDIRGFTTISETLNPDQVADLLNLLFTDLMDLIFSHDGSVNKLIGDAILATFGAPFQTEQDARNAVSCALAMRQTIHNFNMVKPAYLKQDIRIGIGITTGTVFAGNIGSYRRMEYTVIGDTVNTASRLQNLTKKAGVEILIDGETRMKAGEGLTVRKLRVSSVRGKSKDVEIYILDSIEDEKDTSKANDDIEFF